MIKTRICIVAMVLAALVPSLVAAETVGVVFNGASEVNRETFMFFRKAVGQSGYSYDFVAVAPSASVEKGKYAGIIVLNTGLASGTDPVLADFIAKNKAKAAIVQVNLYQNQSAVTVTVVGAKSNPAGVDAVTSASLWNKGGRGGPGAGGAKPAAPPAGGQGGFGGGLNPQELLHLEWFKAALKLIAEKKA